GGEQDAAVVGDRTVGGPGDDQIPSSVPEDAQSGGPFGDLGVHVAAAEGELPGQGGSFRVRAGRVRAGVRRRSDRGTTGRCPWGRVRGWRSPRRRARNAARTLRPTRSCPAATRRGSP